MKVAAPIVAKKVECAPAIPVIKPSGWQKIIKCNGKRKVKYNVQLFVIVTVADRF